jgi:Fe-S-cluster containining protein
MDKNKKNCNQCGKCCEGAFFIIDDAYTEGGLDYLEWARNHGLKIAFRENSEGKRLWGIELDTPCKYLQKGADGKSFCAVYENRPKMCRIYTGEKEFPDCGFK